MAFATLGRVTAFHNEKNIVLKLGVSSNCLKRLNRFISNNFEVTDSYRDYHPHVTVAYLRHNKLDPYYYTKYHTNDFEGTEIEFTELIYRTADRKEDILPALSP